MAPRSLAPSRQGGRGAGPRRPRGPPILPSAAFKPLARRHYRQTGPVFQAVALAKPPSTVVRCSARQTVVVSVAVSAGRTHVVGLPRATSAPEPWLFRTGTWPSRRRARPSSGGAFAAAFGTPGRADARQIASRPRRGALWKRSAAIRLPGEGMLRMPCPRVADTIATDERRRTAVRPQLGRAMMSAPSSNSALT
jgi:hypothetical protein